jgi:hypothetical protein
VRVPPGWLDRATPAKVGGLAGAAAGLVMLWPWMRPGSLLVRDLVAIGDPAWSTRMLLRSSRLPRDIPGEALTALLGQVAPGDLLVRLALLGGFVALGAGAARLGGPRGSLAAAAVTGVAVVWNPWVWSRLHQGQWLVVIALATLPWVLVHLRDGRQWGLARTMVVAGFTGFAALVVVVPSLVLVALVRRRWSGLLVGLAVAGSMALPYLVVAPRIAADPDGFAAFAPSADLPMGTATSLLSGGGYFNAGVVGGWRATVGIAVVATLVAIAAVVGAASWRVAPHAPADPLARTAAVVAGAAGLVLVSLTATESGQAWLAAQAVRWPWLSVFRDGHRLLGPWVVVLAVGAGHLARLAVRRWPGGGGIAAVGVAVVILALPDPLVGPRLPPPSHLPASWQQAADVIDDAPNPGAVLVVPYGQTQAYPFTDGRPVAVPLRRMVEREVLVDTRLVVRREDGRELVVDDVGGGEPIRALARDPATADGAAFAEAGIAWVAVTDPSRFVEVPAAGMSIALRAPTIQLLQVDEEFAVGERGPPRWPLLLDLVVAALAVTLLLVGGRDGDRRDAHRGSRAPRSREARAGPATAHPGER